MKPLTIAAEYIAKPRVNLKKAQELYDELDSLPGAAIVKAEVNSGSKYLVFEFKDSSKIELSLYISPHDQTLYQTHLKAL